VAAAVAILLGRYPHSARQFDPGGVLGVLNAVLYVYGMIGLLGAEISIVNSSGEPGPDRRGHHHRDRFGRDELRDGLLWHFARLRRGGRRAPPGPVDRADRLETQR
jgi:hypothetical protein